MLQLTQALRRLLPTVILLPILAIAVSTDLRAQQSVEIGAAEIGGVVASSKGPEAGVWVIAETTELPTKFARIVVTDDQGRYLIPDLPTANYSVWVRGYGLVDSAKMRAKPGMTLDLAAVPAPNAAAAAHYYPAIYWYTLMKIPPASEFGGKGAIPEKITQNDWLRQMNNVDCIGCHQLGQESTRTIPAALGRFNSGEDAWMRRTQSGQSGEQMTNRLAGQFGGVPYKYFGEWTDRIAKGEVPKIEPPRPQGVERNVVITSWEWSTPDKYLHDLISSDRPARSRTSRCRYVILKCRYRLDRAMLARSSRWQIRHTGAARCCGTRAPTITIPCSTSKAASGSRRPYAAWIIRRGARKAPRTNSRRFSRWIKARGKPPCSIPRR